MVLAFNRYFFLFHGILTVLVLLGIHDMLWIIGAMGGLGHCIGCCAHLACIIVTGVFRFSTEGGRCADNEKVLDEDGTTFSDMGDAIKNLFIS